MKPYLADQYRPNYMLDIIYNIILHQILIKMRGVICSRIISYLKRIWAEGEKKCPRFFNVNRHCRLYPLAMPFWS